MTEKKQLDLSFLRPQFNEVELPSRGKYYTGIPILENAKLHIRPMTSAEEKIIDKFNQNTFFTAVNDIISKCIQEDIDVDELTLGDRIFILLAIRSMSYGSTYEIKFKCPECEAEAPMTIDLAEFEPTYVEDEVVEPFELILPISKAKVRMIIPRTGHIRESTDRSYADQKKSGVFVSPSVYQKALCCEEFIFPESSADAGYVVKQDNFKFLLGIMSRLNVNDMRAIDDLFASHDHGFIDPIIKHCPVCNASFEQYLVLNWDFFRPRTRRKKDSDVHEFLDNVSDWESDGTSGKRTARSGKVRKLQLVGDSDTDISSET